MRIDQMERWLRLEASEFGSTPAAGVRRCPSPSTLMPTPATKANERPRYFTVDEDLYEIAAVLDQWYEASAVYFKVQSTEGKTYLLRYDEDTDEWTLQSGF